MKSVILSLLLCLSLPLAAQDILVKYSGSRPTINDFVTALVLSGDEDEEGLGESLNAFSNAWKLQQAGKPMPESTTLTVDAKNGFVCYESKDEGNLLRIEMCYWNESDQRHKIFAYNVAFFRDGSYNPGQFDGLGFYRYDNATHKMTYNYDIYPAPMAASDGAWISYALPRVGKDITATIWHKSGQEQKTVKWNGHGFAQ